MALQRRWFFPSLASAVLFASSSTLGSAHSTGIF